jgi:hypothetical protein
MADHTQTRTEAVDTATRPKQAEKSLGELFSVMTTDLSTLFNKEIQLAKTELRSDIQRTGRGAGMLGAAGVSGWLALLFLSLAAAWLLDQAMNTALAFAIVGVVWGVAAAVLLSAGRKKLKEIEGLPQTKDTIKEDVQWAKAQRN